MQNDIPTFSDLVMVESLAHHKSISKAAKELAVSASALSRQLSSLEVNLGFRIFERDTRTVSITSTGIEFTQVAKKVLLTADDYLGCFKPHIKERLSKLTISALPSIIGLLLPKLLDGFMKTHPDIKLVVNDEYTPELVETIRSGNVDLGFTVGTVSVRSNLSFLPLADEKFVVISGKKDKSIVKDEYSLKEVLELPVISSKKGTSYRDYVESVCERKSLHFTPRIEVSQLSTAVAMVSEGLGIAILPTLVLPIYSTKKLKYHKVRDFKLSSKIGIAYRSEVSLSQTAKNFLNHTKLEFQSIFHSISEGYPL